MKRLMYNLFIAVIILLSSLAYANTGLLFSVTQSGASASANVILCLNGKGALSCQNYHFTARDLKIRTAANHHYPAAGIKVLSPGYQVSGCTLYSNGYCLFAVSSQRSATIRLKGNYTVGGSVSGYTSNGLILQNNGINNLAITQNGTFTFTQALAAGSTYNVTILSQPAGQICGVTNGTGTISNTNVNNVSVMCSDTVALLTSSVPTLALSVPGLTTTSGINTSGLARTITVKNVGSVAATGVACPSSASPSIASIACAGCGTIQSNGACTIKITPSNIPSAAAVDVNPNPIMLSIQGDNTNALALTINILTYGSFYKGGWLFSIVETADVSASIGGTVAATIDQAGHTSSSIPPSVFWSSDGNMNVTYDIIPLIDEDVSDPHQTYNSAKSNYDQTYSCNTTTCPFPKRSSFSTCNGAFNGKCNSANILALYGIYTTDSTNGTVANVATNANSYAAGLCKDYSEGVYDDWYLPSICEMGYYLLGDDPGCGSSPGKIPNMLENLVQNTNGNIGGLSDFYWSSTEVANTPLGGAWCQYFEPNGNYQQLKLAKYFKLGVRCVRALK